jgi:hypothetical protein
MHAMCTFCLLQGAGAALSAAAGGDGADGANTGGIAITPLL